MFLIAILVVSVANLLVGVLQTGLMLKQPPATATESSFELPAKYDAVVLAKVARRITEPFNRGDLDGLYNAFDEAAKLQMSRETFEVQVKALDLFGKVEAASYETARKVQNEWGNTYELKYIVKLSGGRFNSGQMTVIVIDRASDLGIWGFNINGTQ